MAHNTFDKHNFSDKQIEDFRHAFEFFDKVSSYLILYFAYAPKKCMTLRINCIDNLILCFHQNGDGSITSREFESILRGLGHTHEEAHIRTMMSKVSYLTFDIRKTWLIKDF